MKPGPEMDRIVAEKVMGWKWIGGCNFITEPPKARVEWCPSTDIDAAWDVVEKMREAGHGFNLQECSAGWQAGYGLPYWKLDDVAPSETAPEAICRAALAAAGVENPDTDCRT